jgi:hypothetical protein
MGIHRENVPFMVSTARSPSFETERDTMVAAKIKFREIAMQESRS